ncbi:MAG: hypothetical protein Q9177_006303, partial [Variospora cf. flavescens]
MAGIGEASAILAVAHIGISLSNTLIAYVNEVQDAPHRIHRIGNEILTTSERLKDIGELVETNGKTQTLSKKGVESAEQSVPLPIAQLADHTSTSSTSEKAKFRKDIPGLSQTREWAARKAYLATEWAKDRERDPYFIERNLDSPQAEPEMLQDFFDFQERRMREQEEKELAEQEASKKKAEKER